MKNIGIYLFKTNETFTNKVYNLDNLPMRKIYQEYSKMTPFSVSNINRDVFVALNSPERNVICFVDALKLPLKVCNKIFNEFLANFMNKNNDIKAFIAGGRFDEKDAIANSGINFALEAAEICDKENIPVSMVCGKYPEIKQDDTWRFKGNVSMLLGREFKDLPKNPTIAEVEEELSKMYKYTELVNEKDCYVFDNNAEYHGNYRKKFNK